MSNQKTNRSLVGYALARLGTGYVFGTYGQVLTPALLAAKLRQYPSQVRRYESYIRREWLGKPVQDCIGLIKGHLWSDERGRIVYRSNGIPDVSVI